MASIMTMLGVGIASADPINSKDAQILRFECGGEQLTVATIIQNAAVVGNLVGSTGNFVGTHFFATFTYTDPETGEQVTGTFDDPIGEGPKTGLQEDLITCTNTRTVQKPELGPVTIHLTVTGFLTPRSG